MTALRGRTILQIIPRLDAGGAERTTVDIAEALVKAGARALVATEGGRLLDELKGKGGHYIPFPAATKNPFSIVANIGRLAALCRAEQVDLLHARSRAPAWSAYFAARRIGRPFVTTYHGSYSGSSSLKLFYNSIMARGDIVIANSAYTAALIASHYGFAKSRTEIIHRGTDLNEFNPMSIDPARCHALRQAWGVTEDKDIVLLAARLTGWKGQKILIEALRQVIDRGFKNLVVVLAGDDQGRTAYRAELDSLITRRGLTDFVRIVGHCTDMPAAFLAARVVVVPSTEPEAFGRSAVEAQAMGTPVIVSELGAVPETVLAPPDTPRDQRTGWHVPPGDVSACAHALMDVLRLSADEHLRLRDRARLHVETHFSLNQMTDKTLSVYRRLITEHMRAV